MKAWRWRLAFAGLVAGVACVALLAFLDREPSVPLARLEAADEALGPLCEQGTAEGDTPETLGTVHLRLLLGGVSEADAAHQLARLRGYFRPLGLEVAVDEAHRLARSELLTMDNDELNAALRARGLDPNTDGEAERAATAELLLSPIRSFLSAHAAHDAEPAQVVQIVLLHRISAPAAAATRALPGLRGLAFDGHGAATDLPLELRNALGDASGPPTVFVSVADLPPEGSGIVDTTLMHELGHALGLTHVESPTNLMSPSPHRCTPVLTPSQREAIATRLR